MATNSPKYRDYFITINESAPCYDKALSIVKELNLKLYALIVHDKDVLLNDDGVFKPKKVHKHLMIELKNPVSFNAMQKRFEGAHIEVPKYKKSAYQYLIHNSPNSKEKYQYDFKEIISNNLDEVKIIIESETFELFYENKFLIYIHEGVRTPYQFAKRFGLNAYKQYWKPYKDMLDMQYDDPEMQRDLEALNQVPDDELPF